MKTKLLFTVILLLSFKTYSQIKYEKGYFINNNDEKTICLIKNVGWKDSPTKFYYKLSEDLESKSATIDSIKEFGIINSIKYIRSIVNIDRSDKEINNLSYNREPEFNKEQLFLKQLITGKATLYSYEDSNLTRYFFSNGNSIIEQLIYKSFKKTNNIVGKNNRFRQQLYTELKCEDLLSKDFEKIEYNKKDLIDLFIKFNHCSDPEFIFKKKEQKINLFNLNIRPGLNLSSLTIHNAVSNSRDTDFDNTLNFRLGIELEFILPYNKNKWAIIFEPTYQYFKSEKKITDQNAYVDYKSIELPIGLRHFFFLKDNSKIFINATYITDLAIDSTIDFDLTAFPLKIQNPRNFALGIGYNYSNKYSFEFQFNFNRDLLGSYPTWDSNYKKVSIILGYNVF